jgi:hypothetical protein
MLYKCIYLPGNLNLEDIVKECPPSFKCDLDYLKYIAHYIYIKPSYIHDFYENNNEFIEISSTSLKNRIPNYRKYLDYLLENKVLHTDNQYTTSNLGFDSKCKSYSFDTTYNQKPKIDFINKYTLIRNINDHIQESKRLMHKYKYLTKWFKTGQLEIDIDAADNTIEKLYSEDLSNNDDEIRDRAELRRTERQIKILKMSNGDFNFNCDKNVGRFHSTLTTLKKAFRKHITYNGENLVAVDLKNSQPLFSTLLLDPKFYDSRSDSFNRGDLSQKKLLSIKLFNKLSININKYICNRDYIMFRDYEQTIGRVSPYSYTNLVLRGELYELYSDKLYEEHHIRYNRSETKEKVFSSLYSSNSCHRKFKYTFQNMFPNEFEIFEDIKEVDKSLLPRILQMIESYMFLDVISKRISIEKPNLPIFTIHDSIVTTAGNEYYVMQVCLEEFKKVLSIDAPFKLEYWDEESN